jgi:tRNA threonylcarbamoyladenosine biosynthesis protein TsaE
MTVWAIASADEMHEAGRRLARFVRAGDLVVLKGALGSGKTTLTRGLGEGMDVRGAVTSPTFVIARIHPSNGTGPALVHVDAYRLGGIDEVDDLDLDASLPDSVTVVEWGEGKVEDVAEDRLVIELTRDESTDEIRLVRTHPVGSRWEGVDLGPAFDLSSAPD